MKIMQKKIGARLRKNITVVVISSDLLEFFKGKFPVAKIAFLSQSSRRFVPSQNKYQYHTSLPYTQHLATASLEYQCTYLLANRI
jgi:hypothetical protein